ncbi:MAG: acetyl-CoA hydrolase/transferase C-terminal domain-containing protein [Chloroflexota bacterium]
MDWQEEYKRKLVTAEEAVRIVKSGDRVVTSVPGGGEAISCTEALAARIDELRNVEIHCSAPSVDNLWFQPGCEESFKVTVLSFTGQVARPMLDERRGDYAPVLFSLQGKAETEGRPGIRGTDVFITVVSPPDKHGYCSFGSGIWAKKWYAKSAKKVIAEVDNNQIRVYGGDNLIHVSEIDYFVEHTPPPRQYIRPVPEEFMKAIGQYVGTLIKDRDTLQIGTSSIGSTLPGQGIFDDKHDLGYFAEMLAPGIVELVRKGVINGKYDTLHPGKIVCQSFLGGTPEELAYIDQNPMFELYPQDYVINIRNVAAHDNMVAINGALSIDLTGQIASESIGPRMWTGSGGQPDFAIGAMLSKGGRSITMLQSTAANGKISRIVPFLEPGTIVTVPRNFADYIVTEYGIANLLEKSQRERALELIAIAHPDFREELRKQAQKLFWP